MRRSLAVLALAALVHVPSAWGWTWPVEGPVVRPFVLGSDPYAAGQHRGIDIGGDPGTTVRAATGGTVSFAGTVPSGGKTVTVRTADGLSVTYLELGAIRVLRGAEVVEGDAVGTVGSASHVHFGVRTTADEHGYLDPLRFLPAPATRSVRAEPAEPEQAAVAQPPPVTVTPEPVEPRARAPKKPEPTPEPTPALASPPKVEAPRSASTPVDSTVKAPRSPSAPVESARKSEPASPVADAVAYEAPARVAEPSAAAGEPAAGEARAAAAVEPEPEAARESTPRRSSSRPHELAHASGEPVQQRAYEGAADERAVARGAGAVQATPERSGTGRSVADARRTATPAEPATAKRSVSEPVSGVPVSSDAPRAVERRPAAASVPQASRAGTDRTHPRPVLVAALIGLLALGVVVVAAVRRQGRSGSERAVAGPSLLAALEPKQCLQARSQPSRLLHGCVRDREPAWLLSTGPRKRVAVPSRPLPRSRRRVSVDARA